jgi:hypothetical protein
LPQPTLSDIHVNVPLTNLSIAYLQDQKEFVADKVFPIVPVNHQADRYYLYNRDQFFRTDAAERALSSESEGSGYTVDNTPSYYCKTYALHKDVDDQIRANSDSVLNPDRDATEFVTRQMLIKRELIWTTNYFGTGIWTGGSGATDQTGVAGAPGANQFKQWDQPNSTPIEDIRKQALQVKSQTGFRPNKLVLGPYTFNSLINNPEIVDRIKYTQAEPVDMQLLAKTLGVAEVVVPESVQNTANENATAVYSFIYGKAALLVYAAPAPGLMVPSGGYTFSWQTYLNGTATTAIRRFRMEHLRSDRVEAEMSFDMKLVGASLGVYFTSAIA